MIIQTYPLSIPDNRPDPAGVVTPGAVRSTRFREKVPVSPRFRDDGNVLRCTREYYVRWNGNTSFDNIRKDFLGYTEVRLRANGSPYLSRVTPHLTTMFGLNMYAKTCDIDPSIDGVPQGTDTNTVAKYDEVLVTVGYETCNYDISEDAFISGFGAIGESRLQRYVTLQWETTARYERIPNAAALKWTDPPYDNNNPIPMAHGTVVVFCEGELYIHWHQIPLDGINWPAINFAVGKTNDAPIGSRGTTFSGRNGYEAPGFSVNDKETFVCLAPRFTEPRRMANGAMACDVIFRHKWIPQGTNKFYRWEVGQFQTATVNGLAGGTKLFKQADFAAMMWN